MIKFKVIKTLKKWERKKKEIKRRMTKEEWPNQKILYV
jgi:hypothetical protein